MLPLKFLIERAEKDVDRSLPLDDDARIALKTMADGDGRYLLNCVESLFDLTREDERLDNAALTHLLQKRAPAYDKNKEGHYNLISALHKSLRGSDADAALYWTAAYVGGW